MKLKENQVLENQRNMFSCISPLYSLSVLY